MGGLCSGDRQFTLGVKKVAVMAGPGVDMTAFMKRLNGKTVNQAPLRVKKDFTANPRACVTYNFKGIECAVVDKSPTRGEGRKAIAEAVRSHAGLVLLFDVHNTESLEVTDEIFRVLEENFGSDSASTPPAVALVGLVEDKDRMIEEKEATQSLRAWVKKSGQPKALYKELKEGDEVEGIFRDVVYESAAIRAVVRDKNRAAE